MNQKHTIEDFVLDEKFRKWVLAPDEKTNVFWENWQKQNVQDQPKLLQARELLLNIPEIRYVYTHQQEDRVWNNIKQKVNLSEESRITDKVIALNSTTVTRKKENTKRVWFHYLKGGIAASVMMVISFFAVYFWSRTKAPEVLEAPQWIVKENPYGQKSAVYLSDGSEVILNAGSEIRYMENFQSDIRKVQLKGEAFFSVTKNPNKPFDVISGDIVTRALGTSFNVKAYPDETVQVALVTGKVQVTKRMANHADSVLLLPGEGVSLNPKAPDGLVKEPYDARKILSWKEGKLYFDDADEKTVFITLERWYGVKIHPVNSSPKKWSYTAEVSNISLDLFLESLSFSMDFSYEIDNKEVTIQYNN